MNMRQSSGQGNKGKLLQNGIRFLLLALLTGFALYYVLKDDPKKTFEKILTINLFPFFLCLFVVAILMVLDGWILTLLSRIYKKDYSFSQGLCCSLIGSCFGSFNKAGGHLTQAITLTRQNVESYHSASIVTMNFLMYQLTLTIYSMVMVIVGYGFVNQIPLDLLGNLPIFYLSLIAFSVDVLFLLLILLVSLSKHFHRVLIEFCMFFSRIFHLKNPVEARKSLVMKVTTYRIEFKRLLLHKRLVLFVFFVGILRQIVMNSLPFFSFWCMGVNLSFSSFLPLLSGSSYLNLISTLVPTGAPEIGFQSIFSYLLRESVSDGSFITSANLLWRFLTFYFPIVVGGIVFASFKAPAKRVPKDADFVTMYDFQVLNYEKTKDMKIVLSDEEVLSDAEIEKTLDKIKNEFARIQRKTPPAPEPPITPSREKEILRKVMEEVEILSKNQSIQKNEIAKEADEENLIMDSKQKEKANKKEEKARKKAGKRLERSRRKLERLQPCKTTVTYDEKMGINLGESAYVVSETFTTSDESEDEFLSEEGPIGEDNL